jgi:hypothetical protein
MIATDHFTFVHLHKSGGSFVSQFLLRFVPSARRIGYHYPLALLPQEHRDLPVLGCVRNPWDFYVSYYAFQSELLADARRRADAMSGPEIAASAAAGRDIFNGVDVLFDEASRAGTGDFASVTRTLLRLGTDDVLLDHVQARMPTELDRRDRAGPIQAEGFRGMNVRARDLARIRGTGDGLYTFLFRHLYGDARDVTFLRMESLRSDLLEYLVQVGVPVCADMRGFLRDGEPVNVSRHEPYPEYYDGALAALVQERDGEVARRFDYRFDAVASRR